MRSGIFRSLGLFKLVFLFSFAISRSAFAIDAAKGSGARSGTTAAANTSSEVASASINAAPQKLVLKIGDEKSFALPANRHLWVQNRKVIAIQARGSRVVVTGQSEGTTSAQIGNQTLQIQVVQPVKVALDKALSKDLDQILGLKKKITHHQVVLSGKLFRWEDWQRLAETSANLDIPYVMAAEIPVGIQGKVEELWAKKFAAEGLAPVPVHFAQPLRAMLSVSAAIFEKYEAILAPYGVVLEKDPDAIAVAPVVRVQITVAEVRRDAALSYGLKWPSSYQATVLSNGQTEFENLIFTANALEQKGEGKILASPSLLCRSGKSADFWAGGEFPIKVVGHRTQGVLWKKYGIVLKVIPKADSSGRMSIALETEVSTIDLSRTVEGVPGLLTNRISSHFDLSSSNTIVLSGLIKNEEGKSVEGLPALSRIPVLGALFSSREFRENRTELVILVRPSIVNENEAGGIASASR